MRIRVTRDDIEHGVANECVRCPIARAIERHTGLVARVMDGNSTVKLFASSRDARDRRNQLLELYMSERIAALESTAEDARTCAEYCVKWDPVGVSSRAGYRVLGQLPPRPVAELDLDDVRVCAANVADNYSSTCPPGSNAARILAALGAK